MSARNGNVQSIFGGPRSTRALCSKSDFPAAATQSKSLFGGPRSTRSQCARTAYDPASQPRRPPPQQNGQQQNIRPSRSGPGPSSGPPPAQRPLQKQAQKRDFSGMFDSDSDGERQMRARTPMRQQSGGVAGQQVPNGKRIKMQSGQPARQMSRVATTSDATLRTAARANPNGARGWKSTQMGGRGQGVRSCQTPGQPPAGNPRSVPPGQSRQVRGTARVQQRAGQPGQPGARPTTGPQRVPGRQLPAGVDPKRAAMMGSRPGQPLMKRQVPGQQQDGRVLQGGAGGSRSMVGARPGQQNGNIRSQSNGNVSQGGRSGVGNRGVGRGLPVRGGGVGRGPGRGGGVGMGIGNQQQLQRGVGRGGRGAGPQGRGGMVDGRRPPPQQQMQQQRSRGSGVQGLFSQANSRKAMNGAASGRGGRGRGQPLQRGIKRRMDSIPGDLEGFIEDGDDSNDWKSELQKITRYDGTRFHHIDDADDPGMEVGWRTCLAEERLSARKGREEDAREEMLELMRKQKQGGTSSEDDDRD
ncbi:hypothetical protein BSKO_11677 [Bryopsis sp. KO-2023]|nr:hypothetical protein BSKO_11677 [Bryopsis sp. KO-2023]